MIGCVGYHNAYYVKNLYYFYPRITKPYKNNAYETVLLSRNR